MKAVVVGLGAVGARVARQILVPGKSIELVVIDTADGRADAVAASLGASVTVGSWGPRALEGAGVVVLALPHGHAAMAAAALAAGAHVVSTCDDVAEVRELLHLDDGSRRRDRAVVVGAAFAPGLSCLLAKHAAAGFDRVEEVHVAKSGTGGPACAKHYHSAQRADGPEFLDGEWTTSRGGSGRELAWFPDPLGSSDCYHAGTADPLVLVPAFPGVARVTARVAGSRRDRVTARLPMMRRPHPEGTLGGLRVEVRGRRGLATDSRVLGALDRPAAAAGTVAAVAAGWAVTGRLARSGAGGLAEMVEDPLPFLQELALRGVRAAAFHRPDSTVGAAPLF